MVKKTEKKETKKKITKKVTKKENKTPKQTTKPVQTTPDIVHVDQEEVQEAKGLQFFLIIAGIVLLVIALLVVVPRFFESDLVTLEDYHQANIAGEDLDNAYMYNGFSFVYYDGLWYTQILNQYTNTLYDVPLHFGPQNLTDLTLTGNLNEYFLLLRNNTIPGGHLASTYLTFDPDSEQMAYVALTTGELTQNLAKTLSLAFVPACTKKSENCVDVPVITCDNTDDPVIYLKESDETGVFGQGNCLVIQGTELELTRAADRFLLGLYNIVG